MVTPPVNLAFLVKVFYSLIINKPLDQLKEYFNSYNPS